MTAQDDTKHRVLFCMGVTPEFFAAGKDERERAFAAIPPAFADLVGRFGVEVIGTIDDDRLMVGSSTTWPWTAYILADAPDLESIAAVCGIVRETEVGDGDRLWKYIRIEARVGRELFYGNA